MALRLGNATIAATAIALLLAAWAPAEEQEPPRRDARQKTPPGEVLLVAPLIVDAEIEEASAVRQVVDDGEYYVPSVAATTDSSDAESTAPETLPSEAMPSRTYAPAVIDSSYEPYIGEPIGYEATPYWWANAEYLHWWTQGMGSPPLATTGNSTGALDRPGTQVLVGGGRMNNDDRSGGRFTLGAWLYPSERRGIQVTYLTLGNHSTEFNPTSDASGVLARPFFNVDANQQDARFINSPGLVSGTLNIVAETQFQSLEGLYRGALPGLIFHDADFLIGYRYAQLDEWLGIHESTLATGGPTAGTSIALFDQFDTDNTFNGAELGLILNEQMGAFWSCELVGKVALGGTSFRTKINGQTTTTDVGGGTTTTQSGLLTQESNIGAYRSEDFATVSEFGLTVRRQITCNLSANVGYSFVYWSKVVRPGDQVDLEVNPTQIPPGTLVGAPRPTYPFTTTDFWAQGLRAGVEYKF